MRSNTISLAAERRTRAAKHPKKRRRKPTPKTLDSVLLAGAVFEVQSIYGEGAENFAYRHRIKLRNKGGLGENLYDYGSLEYLAGDVSESVGVNKWSKPSFGLIPTAHLVCIRVIDDGKPCAPSPSVVVEVKKGEQK